MAAFKQFFKAKFTETENSLNKTRGGLKSQEC